MAKLVLTDVVTTIGGVDYSANINQVELNLSADSVETTSFGSSFRTEVSGLKSATFTVSFHNDYSASGIDSVLFGLFGTQASVTVRPKGTVTSSTNPRYDFMINVTNVTPISGAIGDLATQNLTFNVTGPVTRSTAA